jgi:hypothetical protein
MIILEPIVLITVFMAWYNLIEGPGYMEKLYFWCLPSPDDLE